MTDQERLLAEFWLDYMARNKNHIKASWIHETLGIEQPYNLWLSMRVRKCHGMDQPEDYYFMVEDGKKECYLSPVFAMMVFCQGGSSLAAMVQVVQCQKLSEMFKDRDIIELMSSAIASVEGERILRRELDPEKSNPGELR